ncbi:uncharacterized protein Dana_GF15228, isoform C [Drosophila ananassae]|uniref:Uncharacterized protein, isoform A n=1 Tax=Drosophila ananassae TaxID=7217 RepID=B3MP08_DROAN|nr:uncharacterized protein LOC6498041 [Drosophila ananassae]EDV31174.2 uncharacterized protein Dana_GF15228, isoform A [Drosophila ananassae]KPU73254.1 uncharacterized protein Dana_GF15228, isoform B [Drosophila ananassae]KPU73255.1 uncharacterized protein Dana_GF15228, isoform C [Drosophila ananassae]
MTLWLPSLVIMFTSKQKLQALVLSLGLSVALVQNTTGDERETGRLGNQLDLSSSASGKSLEPPPEFYRGPESIDGPETSPLSGTNGHPSLGSVGESLSETYKKWRGLGGAGLQQRISVGHYAGSGEAPSHAPPVGGFESNSHPYPYEYSHGNGAAAGIGGAGFGSGSGAYYGSSSIEAGIPFDVYGSRPGHNLGHSHYSHAEYAYPYPLEHHEIAAHKGPGHAELPSKALLAKSFLIPLASAAVLGIAAALVSNPLLLQLGTVSGLGTIVGKRKRRSAEERDFSFNY